MPAQGASCFRLPVGPGLARRVMNSYRVLILGGYGFFGRRLAARLALQPGLHLLIAGRSARRAQALAEYLSNRLGASAQAVALDAQSPAFAWHLREQRPHVVINASGPFQGADYRIPEACIEAGVCYIDLADGREYVAGIGRLDAAAKAARVLVVSGASSVPALSGAVCDRLSEGLGRVSEIDIGISPGNRTERGLSTMQAVLSYCGKPLPRLKGEPVHGWVGTWQHRYSAPVGTRLLSPCDVPDLVLLSPRYAGQPAVRFGAGLELQFLHRGMNLLAWLARQGFVKSWAKHARLLKMVADLLRHRGSDAGAMHVRVRGLDASGAAVERLWELVATEGDGPYVPTLAAAALVRRLRQGQLPSGAMPCVGLLNLTDFEREMDGLAIRTEVRA